MMALYVHLSYNGTGIYTLYVTYNATMLNGPRKAPGGPQDLKMCVIVTIRSGS